MSISKIYEGSAFRKAIGITVLIFVLGGCASALSNSGDSESTISISAEQSGLVAEYHFEGDANDSSGNGNDGTIYDSPAFVDGMKGKALSFDGVNDYVNIPNSMVLNPTQFTLEAFVIINGSGNDWQHIISKSNNYPGYGMTGYALAWQSQSNNVPEAHRNTFSFWTSDGSSDNHIVYANVTPNIWYYLVGTFDGTVKRFYINGELIGTSSVTVQHSDTELDIGKMSGFGGCNFTGCYFNGTIDEVRIYNRSLSAEEIKRQYDEMVGLPVIYISTNKASYSPGETVKLSINIENPTSSTYPALADVSILWPSGNGIELIKKHLTVSPGFNNFKTATSYKIPDSIFVPDGEYGFRANLSYGENLTSSQTNFIIRR